MQIVIYFQIFIILKLFSCYIWVEIFKFFSLRASVEYFHNKYLFYFYFISFRFILMVPSFKLLPPSTSPNSSLFRCFLQSHFLITTPSSSPTFLLPCVCTGFQRCTCLPSGQWFEYWKPYSVCWKFEIYRINRNKNTDYR